MMEEQRESTDEEEQKKKKMKEAEAYAAWLEPGITHTHPSYVPLRRLLLYRQALSGITRRKAWECNGSDYVSYRHFIRGLKNYDTQNFSSPLSTAGDRTVSSGTLSFSYDDKDARSSSKDFSGFETSFNRLASFSSLSSEMDQRQAMREPGYSFVGMHCIFDQFTATVNVVKFGLRSSELLAFGASDGGLAVCSVADPPHILYLLKGHTKKVTDLDWSSNNQYLSSSSNDCSIRIWDMNKGHCVRVVYGNIEQLCIRFHPVNNNILLVGNAHAELTVINFSTGRILHKLSCKSNLTSIDTDHTGHIVFAGDAEGTIHSVIVDSHTGKVSHAHKNRIGLLRKSSTTTVQFRTHSFLANGPALLASNQDGSIRFFSVALEVNGYLSLRCSLQLGPRARNIHASFCPLISLDKGEYIVSGSEDTNVYFYDFTRPRHPCINKLQGHGSPVVGVAWNYGEDLLASSDCDGMVIVWKRANVNH